METKPCQDCTDGKPCGQPAVYRVDVGGDLTSDHRYLCINHGFRWSSARPILEPTP